MYVVVCMVFVYVVLCVVLFLYGAFAWCLFFCLALFGSVFSYDASVKENCVLMPRLMWCCCMMCLYAECVCRVFLCLVFLCCMMFF